MNDRVRIGDSEYDQDVSAEATLFKGAVGTVLEVREEIGGDSYGYIYTIALDNRFHGVDKWMFYADEFDVIERA